MKSRVAIVTLLLAFVCVSNSAKITRFHSVGKNYNINYKSNTNTNFDFSQLYNTILNQLFDTQIQTANPCPGIYCKPQLYDHIAVSISTDHENEEDEDFYNLDPISLIPFITKQRGTALTIPSTDEIDETTLNPITDETINDKLDILEPEPIVDPSNLN